VIFSIRTFACGPDFPNNILDGDAALLRAPVADFEKELRRIRLIPEKFEAQPATNGYAKQTFEIDVMELRLALKKGGHSSERIRDIVERYSIARQKLTSYRSDVEAWEHFSSGLEETPRPKLPVILPPDELPVEFAHYLTGSIAWYAGETNIARSEWEQVLSLPESERRFRSTWATYMLGKAWENEDPEKAISCFQQVRMLAAGGFHDRLGLSSASLGREALMNLRLERYEPAIRLYLQQLSTGDETAVSSLRFVASAALNHGDTATLSQLAQNSSVQRVISAYLISRRFWDDDLNAKVSEWLAAVENAGVRDVESAEVLALAAYQAGEYEIAERWIKRARSMPTLQWLQAKLHLRAGRMNDAAALLAKVVQLFPTETEASAHEPMQLADSLQIEGFSYLSGRIRPAEQALAELGALHLSRREYVQSLDALLRAGFWMDAAYVAERVLTADELKTYVDRYWPDLPEPEIVSTNDVEDVDLHQMNIRQELRHLLARRLARLHRNAEAQNYFPAEWLPHFRLLNESLAAGRNQTRGYVERFSLLAAASEMMRTNGMELFGTELEPDWYVYGGSFAFGLTVEDRTNNRVIVVPDEDELARVANHGATPDVRFHYRKLAAALRVEAARAGEQAVHSMPDGSFETARVLCLSATWLAESDPKAAYKLYQGILKRCRDTEIGREAARTGKVPQLDAAGRVIPLNPNIEDVPRPGMLYTIHAGDTLFGILRTVNAGGAGITLQDVIEANPGGLNPDRLRTGKMLLIPSARARIELTHVYSEQGATTDVSQSAAPVGFNYVIQRGDTLMAIAEAVTSLGSPLTAEEILDANPVIERDGLKVGMMIYIPAALPEETTDTGTPGASD